MSEDEEECVVRRRIPHMSNEEKDFVFRLAVSYKNVLENKKNRRCNIFQKK